MSTWQPGPADPAPADADADVVVETDGQLHAVGNLIRQRILRVLRDGPATVTQVAKYLEITKGNVGYHMKVLAEAGFVRVVDTRKVRGVTELYYGPVGRLVVWPGSGGPDHPARLALAEIEAAPAGSPVARALRFLRLSPADFDAASDKLHALLEEVSTLNDPEQPAAAFHFSLFRPQDMTRESAKSDPAEPKHGA